jgi:hypothetical protein
LAGRESKVGHHAPRHADALDLGAIHVKNAAIIQVGAGIERVAAQIVRDHKLCPEIIGMSGGGIVGGIGGRIERRENHVRDERVVFKRQ